MWEASAKTLLKKENKKERKGKSEKKLNGNWKRKPGEQKVKNE